jgi:hypothetical protein
MLPSSGCSTTVSFSCGREPHWSFQRMILILLFVVKAIPRMVIVKV